jgi:glycosyltransferase involved in cell wall biosynthesis
MIASATTMVETKDVRAGHPVVSIGMPVFNAQKYLGQALDAILAQTYLHFEVIIFDNASSDRTQEICLDYAALDSRIRYGRIDQPVSVTESYNRLVEVARGEYFKWAAPDDLMDPAFLERCVNILNRKPEIVICYPRTRLIDDSGVVLGIYADEMNLRSPHPNCRLREFFENQGLGHPIYGLIRLDALRRSRLFGEFPMADRVFLSELALLGQIHEIPAHLYLRRIHSGFSARINAVDTEYQDWYDLRSKGKVQFPKWRRLAEYWKAIQRAELGFAETLRCYFQLAHFIFIPKRWTGLLMEASAIVTPRAYAARRVGRSAGK